MNIGEICSRIVVVAQRETPLREGARRMRENHVGALVVIDDRESNRPVGIVTDRDLVVEVIAVGVNPEKLTIGDVMTRDVATVSAANGVPETIELMQLRGVRRVVVVDETNRLIGIVSLDDVVELLAEELAGIAKTLTRGPRREQEIRK